MAEETIMQKQQDKPEEKRDEIAEKIAKIVSELGELVEKEKLSDMQKIAIKEVMGLLLELYPKAEITVRENVTKVSKYNVERFVQVNNFFIGHQKA